MELYLLYGIAALCVLIVILLIVLLCRRPSVGGGSAGTVTDSDSARTRDYLGSMLNMSSEHQSRMLTTVSRQLTEKYEDVERRIEDLSRTVELYLTKIEEAGRRQGAAVSESLEKTLRMNAESAAETRATLEQRLNALRAENESQLEKMRNVVDEKLNQTLETRLNKSFEIINQRLEAVYKGLGEMQGLARGVGDLKKVLSNVKVRGTFGELQLNTLLEQILTSDQYVSNFNLDPNSNERVDFAVKLPGKNEQSVWLPIDSKFPMEEYQRLLDASEACNSELYEKSARQLEVRIMTEGKKIAEKYILPPRTTDFAILYLPMEGLYAEALKRQGMIENLQRIRIVLCGPTTLGALLNSLQLGFKTLAIEKRSAELWQLLSAFKTEFVRFTEILTRTQKKLSEASDTIEDAARKTRTIQRKLSSVAELTEQESDELLGEAEK